MIEKSGSALQLSGFRARFWRLYANVAGAVGVLFGVYTAISFGVNVYKAGVFVKEVSENKPIIYTSAGGAVGARRLNCIWKAIERPTIDIGAAGRPNIKIADFETFSAGTCKYPWYNVFSSYGAFTLLAIRADGSEVEAKLFDVLKDHEEFTFDPRSNRFAVKFEDAIAAYSLGTGFVGFHKLDFPRCFSTQRGNFSGVRWHDADEVELSYAQSKCEEIKIGGGSLPVQLLPAPRTAIMKTLKPRTVKVRIKIDERSSILSVTAAM